MSSTLHIFTYPNLFFFFFTLNFHNYYICISLNFKLILLFLIKCLKAHKIIFVLTEKLNFTVDKLTLNKHGST